MGQYWIPVNLDKKEFIHPHKLGAGLKLWEQLANHPGTGAALILLCAAMPEQRGGGDLEEAPVVGRWAGDRITLVGDYAERDDLPLEYNADLIYSLCQKEDYEEQAARWEQCSWSQDPKTRAHYAAMARRLREAEPYTDITDAVCAVIEQELDGKFTGDGWRDFQRKGVA